MAILLVVRETRPFLFIYLFILDFVLENTFDATDVSSIFNEIC